MQITLPSGLAGEIRGLKGREAQSLADPTLTRNGQSMEMMLRSCFLSVTDPGIYKVQPGEKPKWTDVLLGDRFQALIDIRIATWGSTYEFSVQCESCKEKYEWELALQDLPRKPFPEATIAQLSNGGKNSFTCDGPDNSTVTFKLANGADEALITKLRRQNNGRWGAVDALTVQILNVEGVAAIVPNAQTGQASAKAMRAWLEELDWKPLRDLQDAMQEADGGIETNIETACPYCQWEQEIQLPFGGAFFFPKRKKKVTGERTTPESGTP